MTVLSYKPLVDNVASGIATFVYPPGTFTSASDSSYVNRHPIRIFQFNSSTMSCPRNMYLLMASMELDSDVPNLQAMAPFEAFVDKLFPGLDQKVNPSKSAIEIYPEKP